MKTFLLIIAIIAILFCISAFIEVCKINIDLRKKNKEAVKNEKKAAETTAAANKIKADARTGNHNADVTFMADKLHQYANK